MVSVYGYATVAQIEARSGMDYSAIGLTDATHVESCISQAERLLNTLTGSSFTGTIPDGIVYCTIEIAVKKLWNLLIENGYETGDKWEDFLDDEIKGIIESYKSKNVVPIKLHRLYEGI